MANKRIILLSDGTGNSAGKVWRTMCGGRSSRSI
jgi:hypothetical protein